jgi:hypothetical protein
VGCSFEAVKAIEFMLVDALSIANDYIRLPIRSSASTATSVRRLALEGDARVGAKESKKRKWASGSSVSFPEDNLNSVGNGFLGGVKSPSFGANEVRMSEAPDHVDAYLALNDTIIEIIKFQANFEPGLKSAIDIIHRIAVRDLYRYIGSSTLPHHECGTCFAIAAQFRCKPL